MYNTLFNRINMKTLAKELMKNFKISLQKICTYMYYSKTYCTNIYENFIG